MTFAAFPKPGRGSRAHACYDYEGDAAIAYAFPHLLLFSFAASLKAVVRPTLIQLHCSACLDPLWHCYTARPASTHSGTATLLGLPRPTQVLLHCSAGAAATAALSTVAVGFGAFSQSGFWANILDVAPSHAGVLLGISNTLGEPQYS